MTLRSALAVLVLGVLAAGAFIHYGRSVWHPVYVRVIGARTVADVIQQIGPSAATRLKPRFEAVGLSYPPRQVTLIGLKQERVLELWASNGDGWVRVHDYPVLAASGKPGPKLREGDGQVPEGIYEIIGLNPNSSYHLSMKLNYPNAFDQVHANAEGRSEPGSDIFIHGKAVSIGCLAMGDPAIEELFLLVNDVGRSDVQVIISPHDARVRPLLPVPSELPPWTETLYRQIQQRISDLDS